MNDHVRNRTGVTRIIAVLLGLIVCGVLAAAYLGGMLNPVFHGLGWHSLMVERPAEPTHDGSSAPTGHAGHGAPGTAAPAEKAEPSRVSGYSIVSITPERQQLIGVRTGKVRKDKLLMVIRAVGIVEPDQTRLARLHSRISGWATKVHVNFVGQDVKKGDPLIEIYSPDLLATQEEFLIAWNAWESGGKNDSQWRVVEAARRRLELWGVSQEDIRTLTKTKKARESLTLRAPISGRVLERNVLEGSVVEPATELYRIADLSTVWLQARVYEFELPHIEIGQMAHITMQSEPDKMVHGTISFIEPVLQEMTRTVKVRIPIENSDDAYKPGMYADLKIEHEMGTGLLVPESALLRTGERDLAFRVRGDGRFEPVEVKLGSRFLDRYELLGGLAEGDEVVTSATFLIDAESRLKAAVADFGSGHQHGTEKKKAEPAAGGHSGHKH
jgi:Cu(I)/Ag(I) efflux system membrane fusion protein